MKFPKRKRPPDEDVTSQLACQRLRSRKLPRVAPVGEIVPESDSEPKQESPSRTWVPVKQRLRNALCGDVSEYRPLLEKLSDGRRLAIDRILGEEYTRELSFGTSLQDLPNFKSWFSVRKREPQIKIKRSLRDLSEFPHVQKWSVDQQVHDMKRDAFSRKPT